MMASDAQRSTARRLAGQLGMEFRPVLAWVERRGIVDTMQITECFGRPYDDCLPLVATEIWRDQIRLTKA